MKSMKERVWDQALVAFVRAMVGVFVAVLCGGLLFVGGVPVAGGVLLVVFCWIGLRGAWLEGRDFLRLMDHLENLEEL